MKLTVIPSDKTVYKNNVSYSWLTLTNVPSNVHALQWNNDGGWIEFNDGSANQEIQTLPVWADSCIAAWDAADFDAKNPPPPTPEQLLFACKQKAKKLLEESDWAVLPDVGLQNSSEFVAYRTILRGLVVQPQENPNFPLEPTPIWM